MATQWQWYYPHAMVAVNAMTAMVIVVGLIIMLHDLREVPDRIGRRSTRIGYRIGLSSFLALAVLGEGLVFFQAVLTGSAPNEFSETISRVAWAGVSLWALYARPFTRVEVLCASRANCPMLHAAGFTVGHNCRNKEYQDSGPPAKRIGLVMQ